MGKKQFLSNLLLNRFSPLDRWLACFLNKKQHVWVLAYHRVNQLPAADFAFNEEIISATPAMFRAQMHWLSQHFQVINHQQLLAYQQGQLHFDKPPCLITFDDGYADNAEQALPILQDFGMSATIFVTTGALDSQQLFWFDQVACWINLMTPRTLSLDDDKFVITVTNDNRKRVRQAIGAYLAKVSETHRQVFLQQLEAQCQVSISAELAALAKPLSWDQVRTMTAAGIEIGVHTVSHGFLDQMTSAEIETELLLAKQRITEETGVTPIALSYPTGKYSAEVMQVAKRLGFHFGYTYHHQVANLQHLASSPNAAFELPRLHVELDVDMPLFKANMLLPQWFAD
jgi:hypothetical protein